MRFLRPTETRPKSSSKVANHELHFRRLRFSHSCFPGQDQNAAIAHLEGLDGKRVLVHGNGFGWDPGICYLLWGDGCTKGSY